MFGMVILLFSVIKAPISWEIKETLSEEIHTRSPIKNTVGVILVTNTKDTGPGSLRDAIKIANSSPGVDTIEFAIPETDPGYIEYDSTHHVWRIKLFSPLVIKEAVVINGFSQKVNIKDANPGEIICSERVGTQKISLTPFEKPEIELYGGGTNKYCFIIDASQVTIKGFAIFGFGMHGTAIGVKNHLSTDVIIKDNFIGLTATGEDPYKYGLERNRNYGIFVVGSGGEITHNIVAYCANIGISITGEWNWGIPAVGENYVVKNNYVYSNGYNPFVSSGDGIDIVNGAEKCLIIGNVIVNNTGYGIDLDRSQGHIVIQQNTVKKNGTGRIFTVGIRCEGDSNIIMNNVICENLGAGLTLLPREDGNADENGFGPRFPNTTYYNILTANSFENNEGLAIDIITTLNDIWNNNEGVTKNDDNYSKDAGNMGIDFPVIVEATYDGVNLSIKGYIGDSLPNPLFGNSKVEIYRVSEDPSGYGEGIEYLKSLNVTSEGYFSGIFPALLNPNDKISAITIDKEGNTSEFGKNKEVTWSIHTYQPDMHIGKDEHSYIGDNIYNTTGENQTVEKEGKGGETVVFFIKIENDGNSEDTIIIKGTQGNNRWEVKYFYPKHSSTQITEKVINEGYPIGPLSPGEYDEIRLEITIPVDVKQDELFNVYVQGKSQNSHLKQDVVKAVVKKENKNEAYQPDLAIASLSSLNDIEGENIYNVTGEKQTKYFTGNLKKSFYIEIENDGKKNDVIKVQSSYCGSGIKFYNALSGGDEITEEVISKGWNVSLQPLDSVYIRVEIIPESLHTSNSKLEFLIKGTSQNDTTKIDAVKIVYHCYQWKGYQPDVMVSSDGKSFIGNDIYNLSAEGQTITEIIQQSSSETLYVKLQNNADSLDNIILKIEKEGSSELKIYTSIGEDITETAMSKEGYLIENLYPSEEENLKCILNPKDSLEITYVKIHAVSPKDPTKEDLGKLVLYSKNLIKCQKWAYPAHGSFIYPTDTVTYYLACTNFLNESLYNVIISDTIKGDFQHVLAISDNGILSGNVITWNIEKISPHESDTFSFKGVAPLHPDTLINFFTLKSSDFAEISFYSDTVIHYLIPKQSLLDITPEQTKDTTPGNPIFF